MATRLVNGATLHYTDQGRGFPLALIHGFPVDSRMWEAQIAELSRRYRVIAPDLRGFGQSASESSFTIESLADDIYALLDDLGVLPCILGGLSMGGYVALAFAQKHPADLRGMALLDTRAEADTPAAREQRQKMIDLVREKGAKGVAEQMLPKLLAPETPKRRPARAAVLRTMMESCPARTIENALAALRDRPDRTSMLASIAVPTLIVVGEADSITPPEAAETMHRAIPRSELARIQGAGHMSPMEQPAQVNQAMLQFLMKIEKSAAH